MKTNNPYTLKGDLMRHAQRLTSAEADFEEMTWKFHAPYFVCGAGEYIAIPKTEWDRIWSEHENVAGSPET